MHSQQKGSWYVCPSRLIRCAPKRLQPQEHLQFSIPLTAGFGFDEPVMIEKDWDSICDKAGL